MRLWELPRKTLERLLPLVLALGMAVLSGTEALGQFQASEYDLKAAFLFQFTSYITWPEGLRNDPTAPLLFGVVGAPELADNLAAMAGTQNLNGRPIEVRRMGEDDSPAGLHVLFVAGDRNRSADALLREAIDEAVLTVTEHDARRSPDSVINFQIVDGKVRFDVSLDAAQEGGLSISARLLQVALRVTGAP